MISFFNNKKILVTGHTGFKGTWLIHLLAQWNARIFGYSLPPLEHQLLFEKSEAAQLCEESTYADINDYDILAAYVDKIQPDIIFHLAAQALVLESYKDPLYTLKTNIMGTAHVLESLKKINIKCAVVMITTDKVYQNDEDGLLYEEDDKLGGKDPYSASKACDEIIIDSYRHSFFNISQPENSIYIASVRAGNVIGGGDYSDNRIIPDIVRAIETNTTVELRHPSAIRPWQHVIEPIYAYCLLARELYNQPELAGAYNIGPYEEDMLEVEQIVQQFHQIYGIGEYNIINSDNLPKEAKVLKLNNNKIKKTIGFTPKLNAEEAIKWTAEWYKDRKSDMKMKCLNDIQKYLQLR